jgi:hypothetical protein
LERLEHPKKNNPEHLSTRNEKGHTMRKAHVKVLPLGAIVFVLILAGGVFPSMAQAVDLTINFVGSGEGKIEGSPGPPGTDPFNVFSHLLINNTVTINYVSPPHSVTLTATDTGFGAGQSIFAGWPNCPLPSGNQCTVDMSANREVTVRFDLVSDNVAPTVNAGAPQTITLPNPATLAGTVTDDGLPAVPGTVTKTWSKVSGPGTVTFANAAALSTTASFSQAGAYVLMLTANDGALSANATVTITVNPVPPQNQAPVVNAGPPQTITLPNPATLAGTVTDDGLPAVPGTVTKTWSKVSGPGTVTFANAAAASTTASFSQAGTYVLRLTATDGELSRSSDVTITVTAIQRTLTVTKAGTGSGTVTSTPGGISCGSDCTENYANGTNVSLTAAAATGSTFAGWSGGICSGTSTCSVSMTAARTVTATFTQNTQNQAPSVNAGPSQTITLPSTATLTGTVTDDGLPTTPGVVTTLWSKVSGPGTVTFANASAASTTASFSQAGTYVLRLTATDGALTRNSDLTITVNNLGVTTLRNDLNADGTADLLWRNKQSGVVVAWLMNDAAIASTGVLAGVPMNWQIMGMGDVNADGMADVIWRNTTNGVVAVWLMDGLTITSVGFPGAASLSYVIKGIGDVDGNGTADLVWRDTLTGAVAIWLMNGPTIASSGFPHGVPLEWEIAGMGDVNADGKDDVIWRNTTNGVVAVWLMDGLTITSVGFPGAASLSYVIKEIGDVDGNGTEDLDWRYTLSGATAIWLMNGPTIAFASFPGGVPPEWEMTGMGDVNGDGKADLIWQNRASGAVALWLMNGEDVLRTAFPSGTSTDWEIQ